MLHTCQNKRRKKPNFICHTYKFAYNNRHAQARARISSRTIIDNKTQHAWTKKRFSSFVSIHYSGNERRRRIATSLARNDFINHKHREIPNRKWKAFCHSLHGILRQYTVALMPYTGPSEHTTHNASNCICLCTVVMHVAPRFDCSIPETNCVIVICCYRCAALLPFPANFLTFFYALPDYLITPYANQSLRFQCDGR